MTHMDRTLDDILNDLQNAIEAYKHAKTQYINEKKQKVSPEELKYGLEKFSFNSLFMANILQFIHEFNNHFTIMPDSG